MSDLLAVNKLPMMNNNDVMIKSVTSEGLYDPVCN